MNTSEIKFIEAEKSLLGGLLLDPGQMKEISLKLCAMDFYSVAHQDVFENMKRVFEKRGLFDVPILADEMLTKPDYLYELASNCCSTANLNAYADIIREKSVQRALQQYSKEIKECKEKYIPQKDMLAEFLEEIAKVLKDAPVEIVTREYLQIKFLEIHNAIIGSCNVIDYE